MGLDAALCRFLDAVVEPGSLPEPVLGLGNLTINADVAELLAALSSQGLPPGEAALSVRRLLAARYGVAQYTDCDVNGLADLYVDLSLPIPPELRGRFGTVMNFGTAEHLFDQRQVMANIHDLSRPGGLILHTVPVTWYDHGFFNINPEALRLIARANGYTLVCEGYHFLKGALNGLPAATVWLSGDATVPGTDIEMPTLLRGPWLPSKMMYLAAYRRENDTPFQVPQQVSYQ